MPRGGVLGVKGMDKQIAKRAAFIVFAVAAAYFFIILLKSGTLGKALFLGSRKEAPEYVLSYADNQPEDYPTVQGARKFAELVQEKTSGRIKINVFAGGEMGSENEVVEQLQYGGLDFARVSVMILAEIKPKFLSLIHI